MQNSLKQKMAIGIVWSAIERFASQGIQFLIGLVMARLLMPSDYGTIALLNIFLAICQTFIDSGFGLALMRKQECTDKDLSTVFVFSFVVASVCYGLMWLAAPWIAVFYGIPELVIITRIVAINVVINALSNVPNAILSIALDFRKKAIITLTSVLTSGPIGLWMAYNDFGLWALVYQALIAGIVRVILLFAFAKWIPKLCFSEASFDNLFSFGSKILVSGIIGNIYNNLSSIVIGKFYSPAMLGLYGKASTLANYPSIQMIGVILNVAYPTLAKIQDDEQRLIESYRKMLRMATFVVFPLMVGLAVVAQPFVLCILGDKWAGMIPLLQILCFAYMWDPINGMNLNLLQVKGFANTYLKVEILKKLLGIIVLCITIPHGLKIICYGILTINLLNIPINTYYTNKYFGYSMTDQFKDIWPTLVNVAVMGISTILVIQRFNHVLTQLLTGISVGAILYTIVAYIAKFEELATLIAFINKKPNRQ